MANFCCLILTSGTSLDVKFVNKTKLKKKRIYSTAKRNVLEEKEKKTTNCDK